MTAQSSAPHYLVFRLVDQQNCHVAGRRYTLTWTDAEATAQTVREGTTGADGRTVAIETCGAVPVTLAIAPPAGGECRPVSRSVNSKPANRNPIVTVRLAFNVTVATAPQQQDHCETLTVRAGQQRVRYIIDNVNTIANGGSTYASYLTNFPYLIVDADTLEVLHSGSTRDEAALFAGTRSQVQTPEVAVDGVANVGIVLGASAAGDSQRWRNEASSLVMYRVSPALNGLTTVTITEQAEVGSAQTTLTQQSLQQYIGILNGSVWRVFTRQYSIADIRAWITGRLTLDTPSGITTWYDITRPSDRQIAWAEQRGHITPEQARRYCQALEAGESPMTPTEYLAWSQTPIYIRTQNPLAPLRVQLDWADLLEPIYAGQIDTSGQPTRARSRGGRIHIDPLDLTLHLQAGFSDNAEELTGASQADVLAHNHPYIYMMLLSACAQAGVTSVRIVGSWRPMLGSILHKLGDALDVTQVDSRHDRLDAFTFDGRHVSGNGLANHFNTLMYQHRYARSAQHIYYGDDYAHGSDGSHRNHLHTTCNNRTPLHERDMAGYMGPADLALPRAPQDDRPECARPLWENPLLVGG